MRSIGVSVLFFLLIGCAGNGVKSASLLITQMNQLKDTNKIFVLRDTGFNGSGALVKLTVNGEEVGSMGNNESIVTQGVAGENVVEVAFEGLASVGMFPAVLTFDSSSQKNHFVIVSLNTGMLSAKLRLMEVTEQSFRDSL